MPEANYVWLPRPHLLTFEELGRVARCFRILGTSKLRLTGGEPLLRAALPDLIRALLAEGIEDLSLTTNGVLLAEQVAALRAAGLQRLNISLDTLHPDRFHALAGRDGLAQVLAGISAARRANFPAPIKLNAVMMRGVNDDELLALVHFAADNGLQLRLIEYMDVGGATQWQTAQVVSAADLLAELERNLETVLPYVTDPASPARLYRLASGQVIGIIASVTMPFCGACDRARLTADGTFFTCLYAQRGVDLRTPLRSGASDLDLIDLIRTTWHGRHDAAAQERKQATERGPLVPLAALRQEPRLEMHTRGG